MYGFLVSLRAELSSAGAVPAKEFKAAKVSPCFCSFRRTPAERGSYSARKIDRQPGKHTGPARGQTRIGFCGILFCGILFVCSLPVSEHLPSLMDGFLSRGNTSVVRLCVPSSKFSVLGGLLRRSARGSGAESLLKGSNFLLPIEVSRGAAGVPSLNRGRRSLDGGRDVVARACFSLLSVFRSGGTRSVSTSEDSDGDGAFGQDEAAPGE